MNKFQRETIKARIIRLATLRATGTPDQLATRFEIAERSVKRIVMEIREDGIPIRYSRALESYVID